MEQQLVGLFGGRLAEVARHRRLETRRHDAALHGVQALEDIVGDDDGVGALSLGEGD